MRAKQVLKNLKKALEQDYLYDEKELSFMREQLSVLTEEVKRTKRKKPQGFSKK